MCLLEKNSLSVSYGKIRTKATREVYLSNKREKSWKTNAYLACYSAGPDCFSKREPNFQGGKESHHKEVVEVSIYIEKSENESMNI